MALYTRSKLWFDVISRSKITRFRSPFSIINNSNQLISKFSSSSNHRRTFPSVSYRYYNVSLQQVKHSARRWIRHPNNIRKVVLAGSVIGLTIYFGSETVPYSNRKHLVLVSHSFERSMGEDMFSEMKAKYKGDVLAATHPQSVRVTRVWKDIIKALQAGLKKENLNFVSGKESLRLEGLKLAASHLEGLEWEIMVVKNNVVNAYCIPGGKIVVYTGLLEHFKTDEEIATIIGHEVAHAVARHSAEMITKYILIFFGQQILYEYVGPDLVNPLSTYLVILPNSRRMETEADYIGLLLMASAGYDPRVAPKVFEKMSQVVGDSDLESYLSTHPSGKKRCKLLSEASVMQEAISLYREAIAGREVDT